MTSLGQVTLKMSLNGGSFQNLAKFSASEVNLVSQTLDKITGFSEFTK